MSGYAPGVTSSSDLPAAPDPEHAARLGALGNGLIVTAVALSVVAVGVWAFSAVGSVPDGLVTRIAPFWDAPEGLELHAPPGDLVGAEREAPLRIEVAPGALRAPWIRSVTLAPAAGGATRVR